MAMTSSITYNTLGLQKGAQRNDTRKAYHRSALNYHPDNANGS